MHFGLRLVAVGAVVVAGAGCGDDESAANTEPPTPTPDPAAGEVVAAASDLWPDVIAVDATATAGTWRFDVTMSSPYDSPERYADAWRVVGDDGVVYGVRELAHDHAAEQPFTRSLSGVEIPDSVATVTVEGRDQVSGWGGATVVVELERP